MSFDEVTAQSSPNGHSDLSREIMNAVIFIQNNYSQLLTRELVATACYLSPNYFSTQFRKEVGICFRDYLIRYRIEKATELLHTAMSINDIAIHVGYQNRNRFIINFRQHVGMTPSEYRKKILAKIIT